jgi:hypothetical protein
VKSTVLTLSKQTAREEFNRAWLEFNGFLVMGGFALENLPEHMQNRFRESQRRMLNAAANAKVKT